MTAGDGRVALVTGAAGFLGSHLVESLAADGFRVRGLDETEGPSGPGVDWRRGDVRDRELLGRAAEGAELIFHLAARPSERESLEDPVGSHGVNAEGTLAVLEAARAARVRRVVNASSWRVYGARRGGVLAEDSTPQPGSPYAIQKLCGEVYCRLYQGLHGLETVSLRYFPVFGPRQRPDGGYAAGVLALARGELGAEHPGAPAGPVDSEASTDSVDDLVYVTDAVRATRLAADAEQGVGAVFNVGSGRPAGWSPARAGLGPRTGPSPGGAVADLSRAKAQLGYEPRVSVEEGFARTVRWLREAGGRSHEGSGEGRGR